MSATASMQIALRYAISNNSLRFKIVTNSFMERGVDLSYLSCFPQEAETLYPPLTYLKPLGRPREVTVTEDGVSLTFTVIDVAPHVGS